MANHASARKRIRRNANRAEINGTRVSRMRTFVKKVEEAIASGDAAQAEKALRDVQPELQRGAKKNVISAKAASRKMSRLSSRIKALKKA
ncbi:MAG TPA: 30S ribosomal protein S20 [Micavibrio sp.]|jgi:small subunit ribosomal protein S20